MEEAHTAAGYFIAIVAVLGGAFLLPPFPIFSIVVCPLLILGILAYALLRRKRSNMCKNADFFRVSAASAYTKLPTAKQIVAEEASGSKKREHEAVTV